MKGLTVELKYFASAPVLKFWSLFTYLCRNFNGLVIGSLNSFALSFIIVYMDDLLIILFKLVNKVFHFLILKICIKEGVTGEAFLSFLYYLTMVEGAP